MVVLTQPMQKPANARSSCGSAAGLVVATTVRTIAQAIANPML
jgi:hypothetical protein